jgi:hypothetical protein
MASAPILWDSLTKLSAELLIDFLACLVKSSFRALSTLSILFKNRVLSTFTDTIVIREKSIKVSLKNQTMRDRLYV